MDIAVTRDATGSENEKVRAGGFRDLDVYRRAFALVPGVYELCAALPAIERYDLASQMRRAAKSIPANIGEGYALRGDAPALFCKHLRIAYGSAVEMQIHLDVALELGYMPQDEHAHWSGDYEILGKMLFRLWQHWRRKLPAHAEDPYP